MLWVSHILVFIAGGTIGAVVMAILAINWGEEDDYDADAFGLDDHVRWSELPGARDSGLVRGAAQLGEQRIRSDR
jgi:hypothetical protein